MGFVEQLLLSGLGEASIPILLLICIIYMFYINMRTQIENEKLENKELKDSFNCNILDLTKQVTEIKNKVGNITVDLKSDISILSNNLQNFLTETKDLSDEVKQSVATFDQGYSRVLNELIRIQDELRNNKDGGIE